MAFPWAAVMKSFLPFASPNSSVASGGAKTPREPLPEPPNLGSAVPHVLSGLSEAALRCCSGAGHCLVLFCPPCAMLGGLAASRGQDKAGLLVPAWDQTAAGCEQSNPWPKVAVPEPPLLPSPVNIWERDGKHHYRATNQNGNHVICLNCLCRSRENTRRSGWKPGRRELPAGSALSRAQPASCRLVGLLALRLLGISGLLSRITRRYFANVLQRRAWKAARSQRRRCSERGECHRMERRHLVVLLERSPAPYRGTSCVSGVCPAPKLTPQKPSSPPCFMVTVTPGACPRCR